MAKHPMAGRVKTRLAKGIGVAAATGFYRHMLWKTCRMLGHDPRWRTWLAIAPDTSLHAAIWPDHLWQRPQGPGDLGARMQRALDTLPVGPCLIIGSDVPGMTRSDIWRGFRLLGGHDAVLGAAPDGGYWMIGARRTPRIIRPFAHVRWSSEHALSDTLANLAGRKVALLRSIADVDESEDYFRWRRGKTGVNRQEPLASGR